MPLSVHDEFRKPPMRSRSTKSSASGLVCYHPLLLFNGHGDCLAAKLRPGNVHSAKDWNELLLPAYRRR